MSTISSLSASYSGPKHPELTRQCTNRAVSPRRRSETQPRTVRKYLLHQRHYINRTYERNSKWQHSERQHSGWNYLSSLQHVSSSRQLPYQAGWSGALQSLRYCAFWSCQSVSPHSVGNPGEHIKRCHTTHQADRAQVRAMLEALKYSNEPEHLVNEARRYLRGLKGNLVQMKKQKELKELAAREAYAAEAFNRSVNHGGGW